MANREVIVDKTCYYRVLVDAKNRNWDRVSLWKAGEDIVVAGGGSLKDLIEILSKRLGEDFLKYLTAEDGTVFKFEYNTSSRAYGFMKGGSFVPFCSCKITKITGEPTEWMPDWVPEGLPNPQPPSEPPEDVPDLPEDPDPEEEPEEKEFTCKLYVLDNSSRKTSKTVKQGDTVDMVLIVTNPYADTMPVKVKITKPSIFTYTSGDSGITDGISIQYNSNISAEGELTLNFKGKIGNIQTATTMNGQVTLNANSKTTNNVTFKPFTQDPEEPEDDKDTGNYLAHSNSALIMTSDDEYIEVY